ncbi:MAG: tRNA lysidine(34) synthetase TilS [Chloroflexota bacterium]
MGNYGDMGRLTRPGANRPSATNPLDELAAAVARGADALAIPADAHLLLAVSGGPDSVALMRGAARLADSRSWQLTVAHLDHGLRPDSAEDAAFVADAAASLDLACTVRRTDVGGLAAAEGRSIEEAGREARYRFLEEIASADALIATAHTADDSAETILLNLVRGSGLAGVSGMPPRRGRVVRPLIGERRATLRQALDLGGIAYRLDPSNELLDAARNRIRHEALPTLERLNPAAVEALTRFGRLAADDDALLDAIAAGELARRRRDDGVDWHDPPARALGRRILRMAIGDPAPSFERIEALLNAAEGARGGVSIELGGGRSAWVRARVIILGSPSGTVGAYGEESG